MPQLPGEIPDRISGEFLESSPVQMLVQFSKQFLKKIEMNLLHLLRVSETPREMPWENSKKKKQEENRSSGKHMNGFLLSLVEKFPKELPDEISEELLKENPSQTPVRTAEEELPEDLLEIFQNDKIHVAAAGNNSGN